MLALFSKVGRWLKLDGVRAQINYPRPECICGFKVHDLTDPALWEHLKTCPTVNPQRAETPVQRETENAQ